MNKKYNMILMSYWRTAFDWFVIELRSRDVKKIAYIINADKQKFADNPEFTLYDRDAMVGAGFEVDVIDLDDNKDLESRFADADLIYARGGNTFDLLDATRRSGFDKLLPKLLEKGKIYAASSAGCILVGPSLEISENDFMSDENNAGLADKAGLNLIETAVFPHYVDEYKDKFDKLMLDLNVKYSVARLHDNQVLLVGDGEQRIVNVEEDSK